MKQSTLKDYLRESRLFRVRALVSAAAVLLLMLILLVRLVDLQVFKHAHFQTLSRDNRVKVEPLPPTRGLIYDRNGVLLAQNLPAYSLEIVPERVDGGIEETLARLDEIIPISEEDRNRFQRLRRQRRRFDSIPIRVRLDEEEVARFSVNNHRFPGVDIRAKLLRDYPLGDETAHVLGYVGRISERDLRQINVSAYSGTDYIGKTGVEKTYEELLHGQVGVQHVEVNALGRVIRVLDREPPVPGRDLVLSLDYRLQREAMAAFGEENGAAVAIDPATGGVLALVSKPGFDPNLFVEGIAPKTYEELQLSADQPLFNRALRGQYPPGSTVKPFMGLAGLETGTIVDTHQKYCPGFYQLPNHSHRYRDWKKGGHGPMDLSNAITQSCDVYFYDLAHQMGIDRMHDFLSRFGFGSRSGVDLTGELPGILPSRRWKREVRNEPWYPGETLIMGIGQGAFLATPLQLASATATFAAGGLRSPPRVVLATRGPGDDQFQPLPGPERNPIPRRSEFHWEAVADAMAQVVEGARGTAKRIWTEQYRIAGKTGTAQVFTVKQDEEYDEESVDKKMRDHALFIAFAPIEDPKIAVAVVVENGGHGGSVAAPIARRIMDRYLTESD